MMLLVLALVIGGPESMRPVELGPSPAASEALTPMAKKVRENETGDNESRLRRKASLTYAMTSSMLVIEMAHKALESQDEAAIESVVSILDELHELIRTRHVYRGMTPIRRARLLLLDLLSASPRQPAFDAAARVRRLYARAFPEYAARLTDEDLRIAIAIWAKHGRPRRATALPRKWDHMKAIFDKMGIGGVTPDAINSDWRTWKRTSRETAPDDLLKRLDDFEASSGLFRKAFRISVGKPENG